MAVQTGCDASWIEGLNRMDLNLVSSEHSKKVFSEISFEKKNKVSKVVEGKVQLEKPIEVVFEGVNLDLYKHLPPSEVKLNLEGVKEAFNMFAGKFGKI